MNKAVAERRLPKTRIASLLVSVNSLALAMVVFAAITGLFTDKDNALTTFHIMLGLSGAAIGLFGLVSAIFYLITTGAAVREAVQKNRLAEEFCKRTARLKKTLFPFCAGMIILLIATTVVGGGLHTGVIPPYVQLVLSIFAIAAYLKVINRIKTDFHENRVIIADVLDGIDAASGEK